MPDYYLLYKPYAVLSQFTSESGKTTLKDITEVPRDVYAVGRLDFDSEGLLLLTNDKSINSRLLNPSLNHEREYWAQVEGNITTAAIEKMTSGIDITIDGHIYRTMKSAITALDKPPNIVERVPPIRFRKNIPTSWLTLILTEGKNRQVRKMTAAAGFPTLRLIRYRIEKLTIEGLQPGDIRTLTKNETHHALFGKK